MNDTDILRVPKRLCVTVRVIKARRKEIRSQNCPVGSRNGEMLGLAGPELGGLP